MGCSYAKHDRAAWRQGHGVGQPTPPPPRYGRQGIARRGETISYGIPTIMLGGRPLLYFAGWKRHISLYPAPAGDEALERRLGPYRAEKSTLKFPLSQPVPYDLVAQVARLSLRRRQDDDGAG